MSVLLVLAVLAVAAYAGEVKSIADLDIKALLKDEVAMKAAFDCVMDKGPCGKMQKLRDSLPQIVRTNCSKCTPKQRQKFDQIKKILLAKFPKEYKDLFIKYSSKNS